MSRLTSAATNFEQAIRDISYFQSLTAKPEIPACRKDVSPESIFPAPLISIVAFSKSSTFLRWIQFFPASGNVIRPLESNWRRRLILISVRHLSARARLLSPAQSQKQLQIVWRISFCNQLHRVRENKIYNRCRVGQTVRMMVGAGFENQCNIPAQFLITFRQNLRVLVQRHSFIRVTVNVEQGNLCGGERSQFINWIFVVGECFGFGFETVAFYQLFPFLCRINLAFALMAGPAFDVTNRSIAVYASHFVRIRRRPIVAIQTAAT